jgi:hypothetical protein
MKLLLLEQPVFDLIYFFQTPYEPSIGFFFFINVKTNQIKPQLYAIPCLPFFRG